jgi:hypothetical protein
MVTHLRIIIKLISAILAVLIFICIYTFVEYPIGYKSFTHANKISLNKSFTANNLTVLADNKFIWPMPQWETSTPSDVGMDVAQLETARDFALSGGGSGYIIRNGKLVMSWGSPTHRYDVKSITKSIGVTALGLAISDNKVDLSTKADQCHTSFGFPPESNQTTGWLGKISLLHLATHTAGFDKSGGYTELLFEPGTFWYYSDGGPNWLAECLTLEYQEDLYTLLFNRIFTPLGITESDLTWRNNQYRPDLIEGIKRREFGSGISANVDAMARIGYLYLREGKWQGEQLIPKNFVSAASTTVPEVVDLLEHDPNSPFNSPSHYGLLWWNNADGTMANVPTDAYWSWGLGESLIVVIPSLDIVVSRAGSGWQSYWNPDYRVIEPFIEPIALSVYEPNPDDPIHNIFIPIIINNKKDKLNIPYPTSSVITHLEWEPPSSIQRQATGSDTWPITWADDDELYIAYADGWGFVPKVPDKLSLGFARIEGSPSNFSGINIRSDDEIKAGDGKFGKKASGMLMADEILYMWVRNANNDGEQCQLAWSTDYAQSWTWSSWVFEEFGYCVFVNFGKNYAGAHDNYVYTITHDNPSAYHPADRFILMRVLRDKIANRSAYEFFRELSNDGIPIWTSDIGERGAIFTHPGRALRSGISYNSALGRYLWWQHIPEPNFDTRFEGGFGIYDAPELWGPWTTVFYTENWDVGPGETASFPTKWMSPDGKTLYLVFSGDDAFSVRKATLTVNLP